MFDLTEDKIREKDYQPQTIASEVSKEVYTYLTNLKTKLKAGNETEESIRERFENAIFADHIMDNTIDSFTAVHNTTTVKNFLTENWGRVRRYHREAFCIYVNHCGLKELREDLGETKKERTINRYKEAAESPKINEKFGNDLGEKLEESTKEIVGKQTETNDKIDSLKSTISKETDRSPRKYCGSKGNGAR